MLQGQVPAGAPPWTIFDRNLVERVLEDHDLPARLAKFMPEDRARYAALAAPALRLAGEPSKVVPLRRETA